MIDLKPCAACGKVMPLRRWSNGVLENDHQYGSRRVCDRVCRAALDRARHARRHATATKVCPTCGVEKPRTEYHRKRANTSGIAAQCKACVSEADKRRRARDPEKNRSANKRWREKNAEYNRARKKRYDSWHRYNARLNGNGGSGVDRLAIYERDGRLCHLCGGEIRPEDFSLDHIIPVSKGGPHDPDNVKAAHTRCNARRGARSVEEYLGSVA